MDITTGNANIVQMLANRQYNGTRENLHKLLVERQIPFLSSTNNMKVLTRIGEGVFGVVELVSYQEKIYAHKRPKYIGSKQQDSILEEAIKLTDITEYHPNIQRIYFINLKTFGFLMDYCSCGSLDVFVTDPDSKYTLHDALKWSYQLADALSFLHSKNIMHRDVKMQNILLKDNYQTLVLTDYGTATQLGRSLLTRQAGTPIIMAPEVITSTKYTEQCDVYSWAIVLWQLIAKRLDPYPNQSLSSFGLLLKVSTENLRPCKLHHCPELLVALMYRSWHSNPNERPTLMSIKRILRFLLNIIPEDKQKYSEEMVNEDKKQWIDDRDSSEKHFLNEPRLHSDKSMNIYQDCLRKMKRISDINRNISDLNEKIAIGAKENEMKSDHYDELLSENEKLRKDIDKLRSQMQH